MVDLRFAYILIVYLDLTDASHWLSPKLTNGGHVLRGSDWLEAHERHLHGADQAEDEEAVVGRVEAVAEPGRQ